MVNILYLQVFQSDLRSTAGFFPSATWQRCLPSVKRSSSRVCLCPAESPSTVWRGSTRSTLRPRTATPSSRGPSTRWPRRVASFFWTKSSWTWRWERLDPGPGGAQVHSDWRVVNEPFHRLLFFYYRPIGGRDISSRLVVGNRFGWVSHERHIFFSVISYT